uniref:Mitochondrial carrier protein n=1 Tax=Globisporangium ultimum (strain ATCC 200006 / CBS 805.95 / DAOM BR144) TaxID=431595 RepID=K3X835_GLOUD
MTTKETKSGSASAGMIGRVFCHPIDTVKARLQASTAAGQTMASHLQLRKFSLQHLRGLYRGLGVSMIGSAPATCLYLTSYEMSKDSLQSVNVFRKSPSLSYLGAGMLAEALSCVLWVPIDVIKERMQVQSKVAVTGGGASKPAQTLYYRNTVHAMQTIIETEGLSGMYKGYMATLFSFGPFSALYFMLYEKNKAIAQNYLNAEDLPPLYTLAGAALAGAAASFLTNPLDLIKLRLQIQRAYVAEGSTGTVAYSGIFNGLSQVIRQEGVLALYKGAGARVAFHAPSTAITMSLFESCRRVFASILEEN